jgi:hypothetical protein
MVWPGTLKGLTVVVVIDFWAQGDVFSVFAPLAGAEPAKEGAEGWHAGGYQGEVVLNAASLNTQLFPLMLGTAALSTHNKVTT